MRLSFRNDGRGFAPTISHGRQVLTFEGPGISYVRPGLIVSLTWRGATLWRHGAYVINHTWRPYVGTHDRIQVTEFDIVKAAWHGDAWAWTPVGEYTRMMVGHKVMMSDTLMERTTNYELMRQARGHVLIAGLGIGLVLPDILRNEAVESVLVVESSRAVIDLVAPHYKHYKLTVLHADIFTWRPVSDKFDVIYFDIWPDRNTDNLAEMTKLHRAFRKYLAPDGWMDSWFRDELRRRKRRGL